MSRTSLSDETEYPVTPRHTRNARGKGDQLRDELIAAANRLLRDGHTHESLSLRAVAREVGIAATSIYLHFPDKLALLLAVYEQHFTELTHQVVTAIDEHQDPAAQLRAAAHAYWRFAAEHPDAYYVMFTVPGANTVGDPLPEARRPGTALVLAVQQVITRCIDAGVTPALGPYNAALCLWTSMHGLITMMAARPYMPWPAPEILLDTLLDTYLTNEGS